MNPDCHPDKFNHSILANEILVQNAILYEKVEKSCKINQEEVVALLTEVIRFLNLIAFSEQRLTPGKMVDDAWHEFILCTKAYWEFCEETFGRMIHHHPGGSQEDNARQFRKTIGLYQQHFGAPPARFWGDNITRQPAANCGGCEGD